MENGHVRTYARTELNPKAHRLRRETKNRTFPINQSTEKSRKPHILTKPSFFRIQRLARDAGSLDQSYRLTLNVWFLKGLKRIKILQHNFKIANV